MAIVPIPESRDEWLKLRMNYIGGSESACLFDAQPAYALSRFALFYAKMNRIPDQFENNERVEWGNRLEAVIAQAAAERNGWHIERGGFATDDTTPGLSATLDYQIVSHAETDPRFVGPGALECKNVDAWTFKDQWGGEPPLHIILQHQHQFCASGFLWGAVAALVGGNELHVWKYPARPRIMDSIRERVTGFWTAVADGTPPAPDGSDSTADALRALYPVPVDIAADIPADALPVVADACTRFVTERETRLAAVPREKEASNIIRAALGDASNAEIPPMEPHGPRYRVRRTKANALTVTEIAA
jgi:predicted phage-related endonuclease